MGRISQKKRNLKHGSLGFDSGKSFNAPGGIVENDTAQAYDQKEGTSSKISEIESEETISRKKDAEEKHGTIQHDAVKIGKKKTNDDQKK